MTMNEIDDTITHLDKLYRAVTGREPPPPDQVYAPIPAEKDPLQHVQEQIERLFQLLNDSNVAQKTAARIPTWLPALSVWESPNEVVICFDVPGVTRDQVEASVHDNTLTVSGRRPPPVSNGHRPRVNEQPLGLFRRSVFLPAGLRVGELNAHLKEGVLEIRIPRETPVTGASRTIQVS
jgi:HSP20 family molecular chaperone IbpA